MVNSGLGRVGEGWVIKQMIGRLEVTGEPLQATHFGTSDRFTLHLLLEYREKRRAIDITISSHPEPDMLVRLGSVAELVGADHAILVSRTNEPVEHGGGFSMDLRRTLEMLLG